MVTGAVSLRWLALILVPAIVVLFWLTQQNKRSGKVQMRAEARSVTTDQSNPGPSRLPPTNASPPIVLVMKSPQQTNEPEPVKSIPKPEKPKPAAPPLVLTNAESNIYPRPAANIFEAQLALSRKGISSGSIDGLMGPQTRDALRAFQLKENLRATGDLDAATKDHLLMNGPPLQTYQLTAGDLTRLQPLSPTWLGKSQQSALEYETILELVAEKSHAHPKLIRALNPTIDWTNVVAGANVRLPDASYPEAAAKAAFIEIRLADRVLEVFGAETNLLAHFPCSIAQNVAKRPVGELHVEVIAPNPNYTFKPEIFPESAEARQIKTKLVLPPGPNNPVGVAWIGLDKPGYGIHGTPNPEQVGRTESHGCFRLANWNAEYLLKMVSIGMPVRVDE